MEVCKVDADQGDGRIGIDVDDRVGAVHVADGLHLLE